MSTKKQLHDYPIRLAAPESEFSQQFVQGMANRMAVSYHKYGPLADGYPDKVSALGSLELRLRQYLETGNTEALIDVANYAMIEFLHPSNRAAYFEATDSDGSPGRALADGSVAATANAEVRGRPRRPERRVTMTSEQRARAAVQFIEQYHAEMGFAPSIRNIAKDLSCSVATAHVAVHDAVRNGWLAQVPGVMRGLSITSSGRTLISA